MSLFHNINRYAIGFDHLMDHMVALHKNDSLTGNDYPPYDIVKEGDNDYRIELAVAGFKKDELKINLKDNYLTIEGESNSKNSNGEYLHKNIARRSFIKRFSLADNVEVEDATFEDGVLAVSLKHNIPEEQRPKEIVIH
jgi:molecular chaperone IbpA